MKTIKLNVKLLRKLFVYDKVAGTLIWKTGKCKGKEAGSINGNGYRVVDIHLHGKKTKVYVHRVCAILLNGKDIGRTVVDHLNYVKKDNRPENLRFNITQRENVLRRRTSGRQTFRYRGITDRYYSFGHRYLGVVVVNGQKKYSKPQRTQREAYEEYLLLFLEYNGRENMCPQMLVDLDALISKRV